jgi:hypothetical protein
MCESFFSTLECELLSRRKFVSQTEAKVAYFTYIEGFYNPVRLHSAIGVARQASRVMTSARKKRGSRPGRNGPSSTWPERPGARPSGDRVGQSPYGSGETLPSPRTFPRFPTPFPVFRLHFGLPAVSTEVGAANLVVKKSNAGRPLEEIVAMAIFPALPLATANSTVTRFGSAPPRGDHGPAPGIASGLAADCRPSVLHPRGAVIFRIVSGGLGPGTRSIQSRPHVAQEKPIHWP